MLHVHGKRLSPPQQNTSSLQLVLVLGNPEGSAEWIMESQSNPHPHSPSLSPNLLWALTAVPLLPLQRGGLVAGKVPQHWEERIHPQQLRGTSGHFGRGKVSGKASERSTWIFIDGRKLSLLGWMEGDLPSAQTMLPKRSGQVFKHHFGVEREDEVVMGKVRKGSCPIDCTHCGKQRFGGEKGKVWVAVPGSILWSHPHKWC